MALRVTEEALKKAAADLDAKVQELNASIGRVTDAKENVKAQFVGTAGSAFGEAVDRFDPAARKLTTALGSISESLHTGAVKYSAADDEQSRSITQAAQAMNI